METLLRKIENQGDLIRNFIHHIINKTGKSSQTRGFFRWNSGIVKKILAKIPTIK